MFEPLPKELGNYDSIRLFYLPQCLPGSVEKKCEILRYLKDRLHEGGCVYGTTVSGKGVEHNFFGRAILTLGNEKVVFTNRDDSEEGFVRELRVYYC